MSQKQAIWEWLRTGHTITRWVAAERFGCFELPARICELRKEGKQIIGEPHGKCFVYRAAITH